MDSKYQIKCGSFRSTKDIREEGEMEEKEEHCKHGLSAITCIKAIVISLPHCLSPLEGRKQSQCY